MRLGIEIIKYVKHKSTIINHVDFVSGVLVCVCVRVCMSERLLSD